MDLLQRKKGKFVFVESIFFPEVIFVFRGEKKKKLV